MTSINRGCIIIKPTQKYVGAIVRKEDLPMLEERKPLFVGVNTVQYDFGVSRAKAYSIIKQLNEALKAENPKAIVVAGKVNRIYYEEACLKH